MCYNSQKDRSAIEAAAPHAMRDIGLGRLTSLRVIALVLIIVSVAILLPLAHAAMLHIPHADRTTGTSDRHCGLAICGAFSLAVICLLYVLISLILSSVDLHAGPASLKPVVLDPPPRCFAV